MHEIQEAAQIITESMDQEAKVIFGTVNDEKLKKGDVKVTIIASGFPEAAAKKSLFGGTTINKTDEIEEEKTDKKEKSGKMFNSVSIDRIEKKEEKKQVEKRETKPLIEEDDEDEWGAVPAFLRRKK